MPSDRLVTIKKLHAFTQAGLSDCKQAYDDAEGDFFRALCSLLTAEAFREKDQAFRVRSLCGQSILDPVTSDEADLMDRLRAHFAALSIRPHHVYFSTAALPAVLHADPSLFERLASSTAQSFLQHMWKSVGDDFNPQHRLPPDGLDVTSLSSDGGSPTVVITMPQTESENEVDFVVVTKRPQAFSVLGRRPALRYFIVLEPVRAPEWNCVVVEELIAKRKGFKAIRRLDREHVNTTPEGLCGLIDSIR